MLRLRLDLSLLLCSLDLSRVLLDPLGAHVCEISTSNTSKNDGDEMWWYAALH